MTSRNRRSTAVSLFALSLLGPTSLLSLATPSARAQSFNQSRKGDGSISRDRFDDERIDTANINFQSNGSIRIILYGSRNTGIFSGRWSRVRNNQYSVRVDGAFRDDRGSLSGDIYLTSGRDTFETLYLTGTIDGRRTTVRFRNGSVNNRDDRNNTWGRDDNWGRDGDWRRDDDRRRDDARDNEPKRRPWEPRDRNNESDSSRENNMNVLRDGTGAARSNRTTMIFSRANVTIRSNDDVRVTFYGRTIVDLRGRVLRRNGDNITVRLDGEVLEDRTTVEGSITVRGRDRTLDRIKLDSKSGRDFHITFSAR